MQRKFLTVFAMAAALAPLGTASLAQVATAGKTGAPVATAAPIGADDAEYRLAPGDKMHIIVFGEETLTGDYVLTSAGNLSFPLVGNIPATDKTVEQLQAALATALADGYVKNPRVSMQVISFRPFYILGEVNKPGEYPVSTGLTLQQAVASAGGYTYRANTRRILVKRATETSEQAIDLRKTPSVVIRAGDTIRIRERHF
ncbi:polysaccharide biosynthesis/export family protein [Sphingomonas sp. RB3P16]|uniref:polysaccharide biosynthesis/export family protein n=1 Tax=Parasphingomonas frigoris TaxID=3096163 RepID=UPI002FC731A7